MLDPIGRGVTRDGNVKKTTESPEQNHLKCFSAAEGAPVKLFLRGLLAKTT